MSDFTVDPQRCDGCGVCVADCPSHIIQQSGDGLPFVLEAKAENCIQCQHCLAVCPSGAVSVLGLNPDDSLKVSSELWPRPEQMTHLIRGRRSVRQYRDEAVDAGLIERLLATTVHAPTGMNCRQLTFRVVDKARMSTLREQVMAALAKASGAGAIPARLAYVERAIDPFFKHGVDIIFRGAPHLLIVSTPPVPPRATEDIAIALSYFELLAQSAGLGTVWCGMLKMALESVLSLKALVDLSPDHNYYPMLFGHPAVHYARTVQRDTEAKIQWLRA